jgi:hypothetical protein
MANSHETRVMDLIVTHLGATPGVAFAAKGGPLEISQLGGRVPASIVLPDFGGAERLRASGRHVRVDFPFAVEGLVRALTDAADPTALQAAMEFRRIVDNALLSSTLAATLAADYVVYQGGCDGAVRVSTEGSEDDWAPPFGRFRRHYVATLHYTEGAL